MLFYLTLFVSIGFIMAFFATQKRFTRAQKDFYSGGAMWIYTIIAIFWGINHGMIFGFASGSELMVGHIIAIKIFDKELFD